MFRLCSLVLALVPMTALAEPSGRLFVIDGDTFDIGGVRVRLFGVDAPERDQTCTDAEGQPWPCGAWAMAQVEALYAGAQASCQTLDTDRYARLVVRCAVGGRDLGQMLVADGLATAYRDYSWDYDLDEKSAQVARIGIWSGGMQAPAAFRADRAPPPQQAPGGCVIKGNISGSGRIYHRPGDASYADTRIDEGAGERWFCSEAEAQAAGWRAPRN